MAVFTCSQTGNWNLASTWGGAGVPGNGDQVVIGSGRQVTVTDLRIIGTSPPETDVTWAVDLGGAGSRLIIASGGELKVRGNSRMTGGSVVGGAGGSDVEVQGGGIWEFDASLATDPLNQNYYIDVGTGSFEKNATFRVTGTSNTNRGTIRSNVSGGNGYFKEISNFNGGCHDWNYAYVLRIGTSAINAITTDSLSSGNCTFNIQNCDIEACSAIRATGFAASPSLRINGNRFYNRIAGTSNIHLQSTNVTPTGIREINDNSFDGTVVLPHRGLTCNGNLFGLGYDSLNAGQKFASFQNNIVRMTNDIKRFHDGVENYWICDGNTMDWVTGAYIGGQVDVNNPHWHSSDGNSLSATYRETGSIYEDFGSTGDGDIQYPSSASGVHNEFYYCLVLPSQSRASATQALNAGTMGTVNGASGHANHFVHCTHFGGGQGFLALAEVGNGFANMIAQLHSTIYWNSSHYSTAGFNYIAYDPTPPGIVTDTVTAANCGWNCHFGCRTDGTHGAYNVPSTGVLGANDINQNPQFFGVSNINDASTYKHFYHWVREITSNTIPGNPTPTDRDFNAYGLYLLSLRNRPSHPDYNAGATRAALMSRIKQWYAPTNAALANAGKDGVTIGAVEMATTPTNLQLPPFHLHLQQTSEGVTGGANVPAAPLQLQVDLIAGAISATVLVQMAPMQTYLQQAATGVTGGAAVAMSPLSLQFEVEPVFGGPPINLIPLQLFLQQTPNTLATGASLPLTPMHFHITPVAIQKDVLAVVEFPGIRESFQRAMHAFLSKYMNGQTHTVGTKQLELYDCDIAFDINKLKQQLLTKPMIVIAGSRLSGHQELKCHDPSGQKPFGYEIRSDVIRSIYVVVSTGNSYPKPPFSGSQTQAGDLLTATEVWDQVFAVLTSKPAELHTRRIFAPVLTPIAVHAPDETLTILYGTLNCQIRAPYARD